MNEIPKCQVEGCDGDLVKDGSKSLPDITVQRFQCRKCKKVYISDIPFEGTGKRVKEKESLEKGRELSKSSSDRKPQLLSQKCDKCGEFMTRTYVYRKKKNSKSGNWIPIGWSCILCREMRFTTPEEDMSDTSR